MKTNFVKREVEKKRNINIFLEIAIEWEVWKTKILKIDENFANKMQKYKIVFFEKKIRLLGKYTIV